MKKTRLNTHLEDRFDYVDYADKLKSEEKEWLAKFDAEYRGSVYKDDNPIHDTPELQTKCYQKNAVMRRDIWCKFKQIPMKSLPTEHLLESLLHSNFHVINYGINRKKNK